ncbi:pseudouridine synthase [Cystobacter ferrugineus]|uniref:Pseudouridine synthase n=1 Tax=Cystobacter ferrugineus TaxID=83449 RepID=A0A1L9BDM3_9BACT|nr:pseudouridine synthase [Cystobacter ferrugineus]OJH40354.1 pseudouridine synthase [Cystobacter ferrugineus]
MAAERLQKYLARAGVASRRHAEELITSGRVTVNNEKVTELGSKVSPGDLVMVDGSLVTPPEASSYFLLYKPVGVVTTLSDPQGRPTVASYIEQTGKRLFPVGRLDYDAEGALLVTDDGALAHKLTHPSFQVPRTYLAKVKGSPDAATLDKLRGGVRLEDGMATPLSVDVFERAERNTWLKLVVAEGRPHLIKRLCAAVGCPVVRLYRPSYAGVSVDTLRPGELRPLSEAQVRQLQEVADGKATPADREPKLPPRRHGRSAPGFEGDVDEDDEVSEEAAPPRREERKPARAPAGRPERREAGPRGEGGSRPAFRSAAGGRAERNTWTPREDEQEERSERPVRKSFGADAERGERPVRKSFGAGAGRGERPERRSFGADAERGERPARKPFGAGAGRGERPERRSFGADAERGERPARKPFGAGAGRGERPERRSFGADAERGERPARKPFGAGAGRGERPERRSFGADAERGERPARKPFGAGAGRGDRPERRSFGADAERGERPVRKSFGAGAGRGERPERGSFGADPSAERRVPARGPRPERREWAPRGEERSERAPRSGPRGEGGARPARKTWGGAGEEGRPARKTFGGTGGSFGKARPPREGAGAPRGRGPRKGR